MHRELMEMGSSVQKRALENIIPYSSVVKLIGVEREPVVAFSPKSMAAQAYQNLWAEINHRVLCSD